MCQVQRLASAQKLVRAGVVERHCHQRCMRGSWQAKSTFPRPGKSEWCAVLRAAEEGKPGEKQPELAADAGQETIARLDKLRHSQGSLSVAQIRSNLQKTMQADAAVFRTQV